MRASLEMCRICSYYTRIDLRQLPTSNPFLDDFTPTPIEAEVEVPNTIVVESPESSQHTAWTNMRRFPSLHRVRMASDLPPLSTSVLSSPQSASRTISIFGPREVSKVEQHPHPTFEPQSQRRHIPIVQSTNSTTTWHPQLQHYNRVDSFPRAMSEGSVSSTSSHGGDTPGNLSPVSDDEEFAYLPSPVHVTEAQVRHMVPVRKPVNYGMPINGAVPESLRFTRYREQVSMR